MEKDILRVENFKDANANINSSHFKNAVDKKIVENQNTSIATLIRDELASDDNSPTTLSLTTKPKIFSTFILAVSLIVASVLLALFCYFTKEIYFAVLLAGVCSIIIPMTLTYFFSKLDTRGELSILFILKTFALGALAYCVLEIVFTNIVELINYSGYLTSLTKCLVDMAVVTLITALLYSQNKKTGTITLMLIACTVASGFSTFKSFTTMFNSLFIKVQIFDGQSLSVGAIINTGNWATRSINSLLKTTVYYGLYQPLIFTSLNVIIGFSLNYYFNKKSRDIDNRTSNLLIIITCLLINALISVSTSIIFFEIIYNVCAILFTAYMFYEVLDYSIKNEKYKD
ncbi:MAG: hypothetical protein IKV61_02345 [Clostridia bacterium]|nr:hypothetical protein [Clostridia bacterium]